MSMEDKEVITAIEEVHDYKPEGRYSRTYDGFKVSTNKQEILLLISNYQSCCEDWGYMTLTDDPTSYVGSELRDVAIVDLDYKTTKLGKMIDEDHGRYSGLDEGSAVFINLETNNGTLQFTLYNAHNGYYGHEVGIVSNQLSMETTV